MSSHSAVEIFTSLRYDPQCAKAEPEHGPFYMLHHHRDRLLEAAAFFDNESVVVLYAGEYGLDWLRRTLVGRVKDWREKESDAEADDNTPLKVGWVSLQELSSNGPAKVKCGYRFASTSHQRAI